VEVGIGMVGLAIFNEGWVHNYIMSPLVAILMILFYVRKRHYWWVLPQVALAVAQAIIYTNFHTPPNPHFYLTEGLAFLLAGIFFVIYGNNPRKRKVGNDDDKNFMKPIEIES
jgi:peptidoglycan/LPS O-acetylase OafA/YrhL